MTKKMKKESGFTLVEMLIVVAIIAILIAVSIPMVTGALDKARVATDQANERSAMAVALITYLSEDDPMMLNLHLLVMANAKPMMVPTSKFTLR